MTIAAGFLCTDGVLVAADTCVVMSDGKKTSGPKVGAIHTPNGAFAIANSAENGNAANTLAVRILNHLEANNFPTMAEVQLCISDHMTQWWQDFGQSEPPGVQFVLGSVMKGVPRLHFCEPPNTVYQKSDYVGIGTGASTADPLVATLFPGYDVLAKDRLWHIAYVFYRAKKDEAFCGGHTTPIYIPLDGRAPKYVSFLDMQEAEKLGEHFDFYLREILKRRFLAENDEGLKHSVASLGEVMVLTSKEIKALSDAFGRFLAER